MKVISMLNEHLKPKNKCKYGCNGCKCPNCGTIFVFDDEDVTKPRKMDYTLNDCFIVCPNKTCRMSIRMSYKSSIEELKSEKEVKRFIDINSPESKEVSFTSFTSGNADNFTKAVEGLDQFTKNWCMNCEETEKQHDLIFRCSKCQFQTKEGDCLIKKFAYDNACNHNYPLKDFGSMGEH